MRSRRNQGGITLLEIMIALTASLVATGVVVTLYVQSNADVSSAAIRQKMQILYIEMDRAYPSGVYEGASAADIRSGLPSDHVLRIGSTIGIAAGLPITIAPGVENNGIIDSALVAVRFSNTRTCIGIIESTLSLPFDASVEGNQIVKNGEITGPEELANACVGGAGIVEVVVRAGERA